MPKPDEIYAFLVAALKSGTPARCIREECESAIRHAAPNDTSEWDEQWEAWERRERQTF